jgi:uncharacterized caspase-like protein
MKRSNPHILARTFRIVLVSLILALCIVPAVSGQAAGAETNPRFALVIGNANYRNSNILKNPLNDAGDISSELKGLGFEVETLLNGDLVQMEEAVYRLGMKLAASPRAIGFFYYAGHGVQSGGRNYLIPVDSDIIAESYLRTKALDVQSVYDQLASSKNNLNIIVLDACRDNPFAWGRSSSRGLAAIATQPPSSIVVYATSPGSVALDGTEKNGVFTAQLLKYLAEPGLEIKDVFNRTGGGVKTATNGKQLPVVYNQFFESEYLAGTPAATVSAPAQNDKALELPATGRMARYTAPTGGYADQMDIFVSESYISDLSQLDPLLISYLDPLAHAIHEGLMIPDPATNRSIAGLAESYAISEDGKICTFKIRRNAFWSDGRPVTAKDFVYSWLRLLGPETQEGDQYLLEMCIEGAEAYSHGKGLAGSVGIRARDDKTLEVQLVRPAEYFLDLLSNSHLSPVPSWCIEKIRQRMDEREKLHRLRPLPCQRIREGRLHSPRAESAILGCRQRAGAQAEIQPCGQQLVRVLQERGGGLDGCIQCEIQ